MAVSLLEGYSRRLTRLVGQRFPIVVNMGNGPFWRLVQIVISFGNGPDSHSLRWIHSLQVALCLVPKEGLRVGNGPGSTIRERNSLGKIHSLQVTLCLVSEEWPRVRNDRGSEIRTIILPCLRRIVQISHCSTPREDILSYLTNVSERLAQMIQFIS